MFTELEVRGEAVQSPALERPHTASGPVVNLESKGSLSTQTLQRVRVEHGTCLSVTDKSGDLDVWRLLKAVEELWQRVPETPQVLQVGQVENNARHSGELVVLQVEFPQVLAEGEGDWETGEMGLRR